MHEASGRHHPAGPRRLQSGGCARGGSAPATPAPARDAARPRPAATVLCIGASTGGVAALERILPVLPADCPPTLVVQHIIGSFTGGLVKRLRGLCDADVREAEDEAPLRPGTIVIAPGRATHLEIARQGAPRCRLRAGGPVSGHLPSVDALFLSAARVPRLRVVAALLTGMGRDGAAGMRAIRDSGGRTIAQDEASLTVFGMLRVAIEAGAAEHVLPLDAMGQMVLCFWGSPPVEGEGR